MRKLILLLSLGLTSGASLAQELPLRQLELSCLEATLGADEQLWDDRQQVLQAIDYSLRYLESAKAAAAYRRYPVAGVTRDRVRRSLERFRQLLRDSPNRSKFHSAVEAEFACYQATGDERGTVAFTGYFQPVYAASRVRTDQYRYPLYRKPTNFDWTKPHPTRVELEGKDGLGKSLAGYELVWLRDRLEAYLVQVQGSASLQLMDGSTMSVGYAGSTDYPYTSLGRELVDEGIFTLEELTLPLVIEYFRSHPEALNQYIPRNDRFVFFQETKGAPPTGSLGVPVTPDRSIATDKSLMPPGALALIRTRIPKLNQDEPEMPWVTRFVLDQDTGSAIKGAGRVDVFLGSGQEAGDRAGLLNGTGELYYLLLKE